MSSPQHTHHLTVDRDHPDELAAVPVPVDDLLPLIAALRQAPRPAAPHDTDRPLARLLQRLDDALRIALTPDEHLLDVDQAAARRDVSVRTIMRRLAELDGPVAGYNAPTRVLTGGKVAYPEEVIGALVDPPRGPRPKGDAPALDDVARP